MLFCKLNIKTACPIKLPSAVLLLPEDDEHVGNQFFPPTICRHHRVCCLLVQTGSWVFLAGFNEENKRVGRDFLPPPCQLLAPSPSATGRNSVCSGRTAPSSGSCGGFQAVHPSAELNSTLKPTVLQVTLLFVLTQFYKMTVRVTYRCRTLNLRKDAE